MAKINLLTIHYGRCYGAVMQTYATCKLLEEAGHDVTVINIIAPELSHFYKSLGNLKYIIREWQFYRFKKKYFSKMTVKTYSMKEQKLPDADYTIVGSDQVWNRDITDRFGKAFYLDFVPVNQKRVALCSSFGKAVWSESEEYTNELKKEFERFHAISIREKSGVEIMKDIFGLDSTNLQDPTISYGKFENLILNNKKTDCIFPFMLNTSAEAKSKASFIAKELSTPLYINNKKRAYLLSGPRHWLTNIHSAKYVITDSFHGLALSILFHKQFFVFCADPKKFTRLQSLLKLLGLQDRYIESEEDFARRKSELVKPIDYQIVDSILKKEQENCREFIKENIKND